VKLDAPTELLAEKYNDAVKQLDPNNDIDLTNIAQPHVTLYLTEFESSQITNMINAYEKCCHADSCSVFKRLWQVSKAAV